jgi:16S rRNA (cytosine1402-N4)-methyltransferase
MRLSPSQEITAADIVNTPSEAELAHIIETYGEEAYSHQIAHRIVQERPIETTLQLVRAIEQAVGGGRGRIHPATKTFQALRIAVNHELDHLEAALKQAINLLGFEGRLVVISYNSLEDRIVKQLMQQESKDCICPPRIPTCICGHTACLRLINKKVITPSPAEVQLNPRSRSAKLRVAERIINQGDPFNMAEKLGFLVGIEASGWRKPAMLKRLRMAFSLP